MKANRSDLDALADRLRKCYQFERNQLARHFGRPDGYRVPQRCRPGGREKAGRTAFHQLALFCRKQGIDPVHYVQWCLGGDQVLLGSPPEPNQLLAPQKMADYRESQEKLRPHCLASLQREMSYASSAWHFQGGVATPEDAWASVLLNEHLEVSPLVRHFLAFSLQSERFRKIARRYAPGAMLQYQHDPEVYTQSTIMAHLPPDFAKRAARYYERLLDQEP